MSLIDIVSDLQIQLSNDIKINSSLSIEVPVSFKFVTIWARSDPDVGENDRCQLVLKTPDGKISKAMPPIELPLNLMDAKKARTLIAIEKFIIEKGASGRYSFLVRQKSSSGRWIVRSTTPVEVTITSAPIS